MEQASSAFSTGVPALAAIPQLAGNSRQGFGLVDGTMRWASGWVISSNTLGLSTSLYDSDAGSRSTGKERDSESGNDYFDARYYASSMGRFLSPDWSAQEEPVPYAHLDDPQSLNLYSYVLNNPLAKADLDGHGCPPDCGDPTSPTTVAPPSGIQNLLMLPITGTIGMLKAAYNSLVAGDIEDPLHGDVILSVPAMQPANDGEKAGMTVAPLVGAAGVPELAPEAAAEAATARGLASEARVLDSIGETKNTMPVSTSEGRSIPDFQNSKVVGEIKDTKAVTNTRQLRIQKGAAQQSNRTHELHTGIKTKVTDNAARGTTVIRRKDLGPQ